ncbi:hypothetical protein Tco_1247952, partial [Tanacetum coccineum]
DENVPTHFNDLLLSGEDRLQLKELLKLCTKLQLRVLDLENTKTAQAQEISSLKLRVKRLEKKGGSRPYKLKRLFKVGRSAQVVSSKDKVQGRAEGYNHKTPSTIPKAKSNTFRDPDESTTRTTLTPIPLNIKDKGKAKMIEPEKPLKMKEQIRLDEELAFKLQAEEEEKARLAREKAEKLEEANISWDNMQAMIKADRLLAERLQAREQAEEQGELTIEEKSKLFVELMDKRKKHFTRLKVEEQRRKLPTKAQKRNQMLVKGSKDKAEGNETIAQESGSKRVGNELEQEKAKKQKIDDDQEEAEMRKLIKIVPDEKEVAIDAIPLATKPPSIVG